MCERAAIYTRHFYLYVCGYVTLIPTRCYKSGIVDGCAIIYTRHFDLHMSLSNAYSYAPLIPTRWYKPGIVDGFYV